MLTRLFQGRTRENALSTNSVDFGMLEKKLEDPFVMPTSLPLDFLKSITRGFSKERELGRGGFGVVYKGVLQNGKTIAVKKLFENKLDDDHFFNEVTYLIGLKHENVVQLLGYCAESRWEVVQVDGKNIMAEIRQRLICFEYINNKSLDKYISVESCGLDWSKRFEIIRKICCGLHYLHKECKIIHLDIKPQNILMDDNMVPKIADFGMSRIFGQQQSQIITDKIMGTPGYMAPEYLVNGLISTKSDIFSLGVIIIELLVGSRDYPQNIEESSGDFIEKVIEQWRSRFLNTSEYKEDYSIFEFLETYYIQQINACSVVGLRCVGPDPKKRPAAWDIIEMLAATDAEEVIASSVPYESLDGAYCLSDDEDIIEMLAATDAEEVIASSVPYASSVDLYDLQCCLSDDESESVLSLPVPSSGWPASVLPYKTANVRDHYRISKKLGRGHSGTTYRCVRKADGAEYACKSIPKRKLLCREDYEDVYREIQIMHHLSDHPGVVRIHGAYEDALFVHIVMELCAGGDLLERIISKAPQGHYSERDAAQLIRKIIGVVGGCHSLGVMHGNLRPENLLFDSNDEDAALKASGFEFSTFYMPGDIFSRNIGSTYYVAPEVLQECYGQEADIWSVGVILYILLSGVPPFWAETEEGTSSEILQGKLDFESDPWPSISDSAKDLIRNILTRDPKKRFSAHDVLCHPWIIDDAVAPDRPTDSAVLSRLKHFSAMNMFTRMVMKVIVESMSEEEIGGLKELFKKFDTDNSGTITFDELKDGLKRLGSALSEDEIQTLMYTADIDRNGTIDCSEFVAATLHMNKLQREENLVSAFSYFDKNANGYITTDELSQACRELGVDDIYLEDMVKDIDQDNDGRIGYDEFVAMMRKGNA